MSARKMNLAGLENVSFVGGLRPKLMEVADPVQDLYQQLSKVELVKVLKIGIKHQLQLIDTEREILKIQQETLNEIQETIAKFD